MVLYLNFLKALNVLFFREKKIKKRPQVPDFLPDVETVYVNPNELNDLLDDRSTAIDDALSDPQKLNNVKNYFELCLNKNPRDLA